MLTAAQTKEHVLNRVGWGQGVWHSQRYDELGPDAYVAEQLAGSLPEIDRLGTTIWSKAERDVLVERQLEAVLVDFWFNHFNVHANGPDPDDMDNTPAGRMVGHHQNVALLPHVLGDFGAMLLETAQSPSMLDYLDNSSNYREMVLNGVAVGGNENYARELMELHSIGVNGGYTELDVVEVARVLTGWSFGWPDNNFMFRSNFHDREEKIVMGVVYPAGRDQEEGIELLSFLADHPAAAPFLATKLVRRFIREDALNSSVNRAATAYGPTRDLGAMTSAIINDVEFMKDTSFRAKHKPPHRYIVSALQAMGASDPTEWFDISDELVDQTIAAGQVPYAVGPPTGYPDSSPFWVSGVSMLIRFDIAELIAYHQPLVDALKTRSGADGIDTIDTVDAVAAAIVPGGLSEESRVAVLDHVAANAMTTDGRVSAAAHLIMCSPEFVRY